MIRKLSKNIPNISKIMYIYTYLRARARDTLMIILCPFLIVQNQMKNEDGKKPSSYGLYTHAP